jgi:hypothetical protein
MAKVRHPNREINDAVSHALSQGWSLTLSGGHAWGRLFCPHGQRGGCIISVWSTPKSPRAFADLIRRRVANCPH